MENEKPDLEARNAGDPATEPIDLAQAFKMLNEANRAPAGEELEEAQPDVGADAVQEGQQGGGEPAQGDGSPAVGDEPGGGGEADGGFADVIEPVDYDPARQRILKEVQQRAIQEVRRSFANDNIEMWSIEDLYERDEQTGRVRFRNPDDPNRDFSTRYEAQQFVDAMNKQVTAKFRQEVNAMQRTILQQEAPKLRLLDFAPKYAAMDATTREVFEELVEPYAVRDRSGEVIGFNVNLDALHRQASRIAGRFAMQPQVAAEPQQQQQQAKAAPTSPAMDMKTGASQTDGNGEPKNLGEALKMYDAQQRSKRKGK